MFVNFTNHNITPPLDEQLVLELEGGKLSAKLLQRLPRSLGFWQAHPLDEDVLDVATELCTRQSACRLLNATTMVERRQHRW